MKRAIYAGSFDPLTKGHEWVIKESCKIFDEVIVVIASNRQKSNFLTLPEKQASLEALSKSLPIKVYILDNEYLAAFAKREGVNHLVRGIRNSLDMEYEKTIERVNLQINPNLQTVYLMPPASLGEISSSLVKSLMGFPGWMKTISTMVNETVLSLLLTNIHKKDLQVQWNKVSNNQKWFNKILSLYSEPHRYYHNTTHLQNLFKNLELIIKDSTDESILIYSIFFHDLIYNPQSKTNEENSAALWVEFAKEEFLSQYLTDVVYETILATKFHNNQTKYPISDKFLDLDLAILGSSPAEFIAYEDAIRLEYRFVPDAHYETERTKIMKSFKDPFKTQEAKKLWNAQLILNLKKY